MTDRLLTDDELAAIEAVWKASTPGDWRVEYDEDFLEEDGPSVRWPQYILTEPLPYAMAPGGSELVMDVGDGNCRDEDAEFVVNAHRSVPRLLAHIRAQDAELARLREALTNLCDAVTETREKLLADVLAAARQGMDALNGRPLGSVKVVGPEGAEVESVRDDGNKANCDWTNLLACCQRCHLHIQGRWQPGGVLPPEWGVPEWVTERGLAYRQVVQHALFEEG